ncbi:MAG: hypothetical protein NTY08_07695 [Proteobacteria bacterium]|nr:hypothetical protein [Pseudomonadota bacterium]
MGPQTSWRRILIPATLALLASCRLSPWSKGVSSPEVGVPLAAFSASNRHYFPRFISQFFPGARAFAKAYPTLESARSDVVLIEVRQLNANETRFNEANLSWSADGVYLGYEVLVDGFRKIMLKDLVGNYSRELQVIPRGSSDFLDGMVTKSAQSYNAGLRWSHDSTRFAFMSNGGIGDYNIYVGAIGAKEESLGNSHSKDGYATWSPVNNEIAFVSARSGNGDIYSLSLSDKKLVRLTRSDEVDIFPDWFPGGNGVVYSSGDALHHSLNMVTRHNDIWRDPYPLTEAGADHLRPTVSPDGEYVAFYAEDIAQSESVQRRWNLVVVPVASGKTYSLVELRSMLVARDVVIDLNTGPAWSPDSRKIFYVKHDVSVSNPIYAYDLFSGRSYLFSTNTKMNRDLLVSKLGILSFRAQIGAWDRVFVALTNQGVQIQTESHLPSKIHYLSM